MANKRAISTTSFLTKVLLLLTSALVILLAFPREGRFRYQFQEGMPWHYGLLTAPYNFSIYKTDKAYKAELDSAMQEYRPWLQKNGLTGDRCIAQLNQDYRRSLRATLPERYITYLTDQLELMYSAGIVSADLLNQLNREGVTQVMVVEDNVAEVRNLSTLFTAKQAYSALLTNLPRHIDRNTLERHGHLEDYLVENCQLDEAASTEMKEELMSSVSQTHGMVLKGERIIDKGEIVNHDTFLKLDSLRRHAEQRSNVNGSHWVLYGQIVWVLLLLSMLYVYLYKHSPEVFTKFRHIVFVLILVVTLCVLTALVIRNDTLLNIYMIPYAVVPVIICTFFDARTAFFVHLITILICAPITHFPFEFLMVQSTVGMMAVFSLKRLTQRSQLLSCILSILLTYSVAYTSIALVQEGSLSLLQWKMYVYFAINSILMLSTYLLIYLFEWMFGYTSDVTLMEMANINNKVLREFSETCPGTFQHSLQVSNLASALASEIGANAQLVRTGALYHDLGKMVQPSFYTENQADGTNPLSRMPLEKAAKIITDHVPNGLKLAEKHRLPRIVRDFIATHHGKSPARYFYTLYKNEHPNEEVPEGFFYPGPNPFSKETAILMMADTLEAASRSLPEYTEAAISNLVETILASQIAEGNYKDVPITFQEMESLKRVLKEKLQSIYHARIAYPKANNAAQ